MADSWIQAGVTSKDCHVGVENLVDECMAVGPDERVLMVLEPADCAFYDPKVAALIRGYLESLGATVEEIRPAIISDSADFPDELARAMGRADHTLFLSRMGDYLRFTPMMGEGVVTVSYARQLSTLGSRYATMSYRLMSALLCKLEQELLNAKQWKITCPLGTDIEGAFNWPSLSGGKDDDFTMNLFPVSTFKPVPGATANGTIALSRWLMPGAAIKVGPEAVLFNQPVYASVCNGTLVSLEGDSESVSKIEHYMETVCSALGVTEKNVHSWHAGINPFTFFNADVDQNLQDWGAVTFGSPRYLHFHTTGKTPPGEIAWSIFNPTVFVDGACFWRGGQFSWLHREDNLAFLLDDENGRFLLQDSADIGV